MVDTLDIQAIHDILDTVRDPEIPVLSVNDLGIVRNIEEIDGLLRVTITPTFNGCPAMKIIEYSIREALENAGFDKIHVAEQISPPWTTDWMTDEAKEKLKKYGIAPPLGMHEKKIICPNCGSDHTQLISEFGSTPCKAHFKCRDCLEPFDYFKCH